MFATHSSFITELQLFYISFPNTITPCTPSKPSAHFSTCPLKSPKETMILLELPKSHLPFHHKSSVSLCLVFCLVTHTHIHCITSPPKVSIIAITLSLFLLTSTTLPGMSFHQILTPSNSASFSDHSLYLCLKVPAKQTPWSFHFTSGHAAHINSSLPQFFTLFCFPSTKTSHI